MCCKGYETQGRTSNTETACIENAMQVVVWDFERLARQRGHRCNQETSCKCLTGYVQNPGLRLPLIMEGEGENGEAWMPRCDVLFEGTRGWTWRQGVHRIFCGKDRGTLTTVMPTEVGGDVLVRFFQKVADLELASESSETVEGVVKPLGQLSA